MTSPTSNSDNTLDPVSCSPTDTAIAAADGEVLHWFALKAFSHSAFSLEKQLNEDQIETFFPCERVLVQRPDGSKKYVRRPIIGSLLFFRSTLRKARAFQQMYAGQCYLYTRKEGFTRTPYIIRDAEMNRFMLVVTAGSAGLEVVDSQRDFTKGEHVRVVDGPFKGAEGYICRIKKNRRLVVSIQGLCAVATSYIPREFLQRI